MKFEELLRKLNIEYKTEGNHCRQNWIQIDCPYCGKDSKKFHMGYSLEGQFLNCWRCGSHFLIPTLVELTDKSYIECRNLLANIEIIEVERRKEKPKGKLVLPKGVEHLLLPHRAYLESRGFVVSELEKLWKIKGIGITSILSWRIFIPIIHHSITVSWTTRSISNHPNITRYVSASPEQESMNHKELLYGEDYVCKTIIITEGCFDVWKIGFGAVATLGTGYSTKQILRMSEYSKRVICFDNEREAQIRAKKLCDDLSVYPGETFNVQLDAKDPATASDKEIRLLRKELLE